jgi:hypothetical protein
VFVDRDYVDAGLGVEADIQYILQIVYVLRLSGKVNILYESDTPLDLA